jgi:hypothetical protein
MTIPKDIEDAIMEEMQRRYRERVEAYIFQGIIPPNRYRQEKQEKKMELMPPLGIFCRPVMNKFLILADVNKGVFQ